MYSNKREIHALVALMKAHGIAEVVCCPGSRNAVIINDMYESGFHLHPVTDERSAGFVALGLSLATSRPVAVCVTSGSALLNVMPAISEAYYRNIPLLVISADRPARLIDTWDGQTIHQKDALMPYAKTYSIEESDSEKGGKGNELRISQALSNLYAQNGPVHLNVAIEEPLFEFNTTEISSVKRIDCVYPKAADPIPQKIIDTITQANFPVLFVGQYEKDTLPYFELIEQNQSLLILPEIIASAPYWVRTSVLEQIVNDFDFHPDLVIHIGGNLVNKQLKNFFRKQSDLRVIRIEEKDFFPNTLAQLDAVIYADVYSTLKQLANLCHPNKSVALWQERLKCAALNDALSEDCQHSDLYAMQQVAERMRGEWHLHLANSSTIRNATLIPQLLSHRIFANRGTNGIEGSISTAVGYALGKPQEKVMIMTGDLSFFYDANALYNTEIPRNLSIIVYNNGGGQIFKRLPGINESAAVDKYIAAAHKYSAHGIAQTFGLKYFSASTTNELNKNIEQFLSCNGTCPALLEVFTNVESNELARKTIEQAIKNNYNHILMPNNR